MAKPKVTSGYSKNGLPYTCMGDSSRKLVIFEGLNFAHKPASGFMLGTFNKFTEDFTVYIVSRKPGLPAGYTIQDMSNDYATMIKEELGGPVDIMGLSTGGPIAQHFAADHPDLINHLVLASSGYRLKEDSRQLQMRISRLAEQGKWRAAAATMADAMFSALPVPARLLFKSIFWLFGRYGFGSPDTASDGIVEIEAEDKHDFRERLAEIKAPTLVIGGDRDFFYPISETAAGIPNARLILYEGVGHTAIMKRQFSEDILAFLTEATA